MMLWMVPGQMRGVQWHLHCLPLNCVLSRLLLLLLLQLLTYLLLQRRLNRSLICKRAERRTAEQQRFQHLPCPCHRHRLTAAATLAARQ